MAEERAVDPTTARVEGALGGLAHAWVEARDGMPTLVVSLEHLRAVLEALKQRAGFDAPTLVTAVDRLGRAPRFELVHQLFSLGHGDRVRVKTGVEEGQSAPSCVDLWMGAAYMERECFDMFGLRFDGHPGLKRLLMPEEYGHHPLRKDFPHQGIEPDRLYREWDRERRKSWHPEASR